MITPAFSVTATERVLPKLALDFTTATLDPRITFTRSGNTATVVNSSGAIVNVNADLPRFDYDSVTLICKGLLIEESRTNAQTYSEDITNVAYTKTNVTASPDVYTDAYGTGSWDAIVVSVENTTQGLSSTAFTADGTSSYSDSVFIKKTADAGVSVRFYFRSGIGSGTQYSSLVINTTTGYTSFDATGSTSSAYSVTEINGWWRLTISAGGIPAGSMRSHVRLISQPLDTTVGVGGYQHEVGAFATSYIPTTTTALTRNADVATMTGTDFSDWFNASEGTFAVTAWPAPLPDLGVSTTGALLCAASLGNALTAQVSLLFRTEASSRVNRGAMYVRDASGATPVETAANETYPNNTYTKAVAALKSNEWAFAANGSAVATAATQTLPAVTQMNIGTSYNGVGVLNGWVKEILYYPQRLTNAEVQAFSKG